MANSDIFGQYPTASWSVGGNTYWFSVDSISESGGNRLIPRERPYRDGAKVDDTGSRPKVWTMRAVFTDLMQILPNAEPGLANNSEDYYPNVLNGIIATFDTHETGDLVVPTVGKVRARAMDYTRDETAEKRNAAYVTFTFIQDNEDNLDAAAFQLPTVKSNAVAFVEAAEFEEEADGMFGGSLQDLNELASQMEGLANAPGDYKQDLESQANIVKGAANKALKAHKKPLVDGRNKLSDPDGEVVERQIQAIKELAGQARQEADRGKPRTVSKTYDRDLSIFQIATLEQQSAFDLLTLNPQIENPLVISAGTSVRVKANG